MSQEDVIKEIAHQALMSLSPSPVPNNWLWKRTQTLMRNVECICKLPELVEADLPVDRFCLRAATYFSDLGFVSSHDSPAQTVSDKLADVITEQKINKINTIISESINKLTRMNEAKILSDARSLDDMGILGIFSEFYRCILHGKGAQDILESWRKKIDYGYWQARLKEGFHFESVRRIATQRLSLRDDFMTQFAVEHNNQDLKQTTLESLKS